MPLGHFIMVESMPLPVIEVWLWLISITPKYVPALMYHEVPCGIDAKRVVALGFW